MYTADDGTVYDTKGGKRMFCSDCGRMEFDRGYKCKDKPGFHREPTTPEYNFANQKEKKDEEEITDADQGNQSFQKVSAVLYVHHRKICRGRFNPNQ